MKRPAVRWRRWAVALVAVLLVAALAARVIVQRRSAQASLAGAAPAAAALELGSDDVVAAQVRELTRTLPVSGGLKAVNTAVVKARVAAEVKTLLVREGDAVKAGQVIGQLDTSEYEWRLRQAEQIAASSRAQLDIAKRGLDNSRALVAQGFISSTGLETSVSNEAAARATYESALAAAELARKSRSDAALVAPIAGIVSQRLVQPGERAAVDARVVEIVDLTRIELEAAIAADDVGELQIGQRAALKVDGLAQPATAVVARINPSTQAGTRAVMAYLALQPQPGLRQGLFATGHIDVRHERSLLLPLSAVRIEQARPYVLAIENGKVVARAVSLGARGDASFGAQVNGAAVATASDASASAAPAAPTESAVEITAGIGAGTVVLRGTTGRVRDGTPVKIAAAPQ